MSRVLAESLFWAAVVVCVVAHAAILRSVLRAAPRRVMDVAWAIIPAIGLTAVLLITWRTMLVSA
jgi:hypothetical protein